MQPESIPPAARPLASAVLVAMAAAVLAMPGGACPAAQAPATPQAAPAAQTPRALEQAAWMEAPAYLDLFAPEARRMAYRAFVSTSGLDELLRSVGAEPALLPAPGAWRITAQDVSAAFGQSGRYDRWALARLYRGRPVRVARGPVAAAGRVAESWTLLSPYPAPGLDRLEEGTLLLVVEVPPL